MKRWKSTAAKGRPVKPKVPDELSEERMSELKLYEQLLMEMQMTKATVEVPK